MSTDFSPDKVDTFCLLIYNLTPFTCVGGSLQKNKVHFDKLSELYFSRLSSVASEAGVLSSNNDSDPPCTGLRKISLGEKMTFCRFFALGEKCYSR